MCGDHRRTAAALGERLAGTVDFFPLRLCSTPQQKVCQDAVMADSRIALASSPWYAPAELALRALTMNTSPFSAGTTEVDDATLFQVIADFLAMGHVDNIRAMVLQEPRYLAWSGRLLADERYAVRLGVSVLFELLVALCPQQLPRAIPGLIAQLSHAEPWVRGEAASVLGIIATAQALAPLPALLDDPSPQVVEIVRDVLGV